MKTFTKFKNFSYAFLILLTILLPSCSEDAPCKDITCQNSGICIDGKCDCPDGFEGDLCQKKSKLLLKEILLDGVLEESFEYNEDQSIAKKIVYESSDHIVETAYRYTADSIITNGTNSLNTTTFSVKYNRIDSDQIKSEFFTNDISDGFYFVYSSFSQNCGHGKSKTYSSNDISSGESTIDYIDENCSSNRSSINTADNSMVVTIETRNDDKNYYYESTTVNYLKAPNRGNPIRFTVKDKNNEIVNSSSYISSYTYNISDYPAKEIKEYFDGKIEIRTFVYY